MTSDLQFETYDVLGIPVAAVSLDLASNIVAQWSKDSVGRYVGVREVASTMAMVDDSDLLGIARRADMNIPDGMPIVWLGKKRKLEVSRTSGPDLMEWILSQAPGNELKHFFYGGKEGVAERLRDVFIGQNGDLQVVGTYCPPFRPLTQDEDDQIVKMINDSKADVVWVGMSSPKQDVWMAEHVDRLRCTMIGVGAAFDFHSGEVTRAPIWMQRIGLEWLHRLCSEPRRLWFRYLVLAPRFVWRVMTGWKPKEISSQ